jgi:hypothetical protein
MPNEKAEKFLLPEGVKTKKKYHEDLNLRIMLFADMHIGRTKKYKTLTEFYRSIAVPATYLPEIRANKRFFGPYQIYLLIKIHGASEGWITTGEGDIFSHSKLVDRIKDLEDRMEKAEVILNIKKGK